MKKSKYTEIMNSISPSKEVKDEVWNQIISEKKPEKKRNLGMYIAASLMLVCITAVSVPAIASEIRSLLSDVPAYTSLADQIDTGVFTKSDEHVCLTVEELLSDGMNVYMTVRYEAIDESGRKWLSELDIKNEEQPWNWNLSLKPYVEDYLSSGVNYSYRTYEKEELADEDERWFLLTLETSSRDYDSGKGKLVFPMTDGIEETYIEMKGNVETLGYALAAEEKVSDIYEPTYMEVSPMSYVIYAQNYGVYEDVENGQLWNMPDAELDELSSSTYFIMADGSKYKLNVVSSAATHATEENHYSDLVLLSGFFRDYSNFGEEPVLFDPNEVVGVEIKGVRYQLMK